MNKETTFDCCSDLISLPVSIVGCIKATSGTVHLKLDRPPVSNLVLSRLSC